MHGRRVLATGVVALLAACGGPAIPSSSTPTLPAATGASIPTAAASARSTSSLASPTASASPRLPTFGHTATLLLNGTVLVAGGVTDMTRAPIRSAEIYDPANHSWETTGLLNEPRSGHVAVLLESGKVLVAGGEGSTTDRTATAEVYDPATESWTRTGAMVAAQLWLTATRLGTGDVLAVSENHAELYDHVSGSWSVTAPWASSRGNLSTLTTLDDGTALVAGGGEREGCAITGADVFDPSVGSWAATGSMLDGHAGHAAALLAGGRVLVAGGGCESATTAELYDPAVGTWEASCCLIVARAEFTTTQLGDGRVLLLGGSAGMSGAISYAEISDPSGGGWTVLPNMRVARADHTATLLPNGLVLVIGGDASTETASMELYDPSIGPVSGS